MTTHVLTPPTVADVGPVPSQLRPGDDPTARALMSHYVPYTRFLWVLKIGGVYSTVDYPSDAQLRVATEAYSGQTVVTAAQAAALQAAGYTVS